jgi:hypothetical protein
MVGRRAQKKGNKKRGQIYFLENRSVPFLGNMAGAAGFEPTHGRIKTCCLTAWRRPCKSGREFINFRRVWEAPFINKFVLKQPVAIKPMVGDW